jgi:hypothetical protein
VESHEQGVKNAESVKNGISIPSTVHKANPNSIELSPLFEYV